MSRIRILFLATNPGMTSRLALDEEMHAIQHRLRNSGAAEHAELCAEWALRADEIPAALMRHRPHVVHFSGHGSALGELLLVSNQSSKDACPISPESLRRLFVSLAGNVRCVVLNACYSSIQAQALSEVLPCVVGMTRTVTDAAAIAFAAGFYEALAFGKAIQTAFDLGRIQIELAQEDDQYDVPVLLLRKDITSTELYLFTKQENSPEKAATRRSSLEEQLAIQEKNIDKLMIKKAKYGPLDVPLSVDNQIEDINQQITSIKAALSSFRSDSK